MITLAEIKKDMNKKYKWQKIWERKGKINTNNLVELDGFEATTINPKIVVSKIIKLLDIKKTDKVLEVGCGAGMLAQCLKCNYVGVDYSNSLVKKHIKLLGNSVLVAEANNLPFKDKFFDKVFAYSVFHYFPDKKYVKKALKEMKRVSRGSIFIGDLPESSHRKSHLLFKKSDFVGAVNKVNFSDGFHNKNRFNVLIKK